MTEHEDTPRRDTRRLIVHGLTLLAAVLLLFASANTWVKRQMLDTDAWVATADDLLADEEIRESLSRYLVDELYASVDVGAQLEERLPDELAGLAAPIAAGLRTPATNAVDRLLDTGVAREVWSRANRRAHETFVNIMRDETRPGTSTAEGVVTIDLREIVVNLAENLNLPGVAVGAIPEGVGTITVLESDALADAQSAVRTVEWASILLFFVILGLFAGAVALAEGWRRVVVRNIGLVLLIDGLILLVVQRVARSYLLENHVSIASNRRVVANVWWIATEMLRELAWSGVLLGVLIALGAVLVGPARAGVALRRSVGPLFVANPGAAWAATVAVVLLFAVWSPFDVFATWWGIGAAAVALLATVGVIHRMALEDAAAPPEPVAAEGDEPATVAVGGDGPADTGG